MKDKEWTPELEKLILEAREAVKTDDVAMFASEDDLLLYEHFYLNGFEAAASQFQARIKELEKENTELKEILLDAARQFGDLSHD